jgi:hypothetical protein
MKIMASPNFTNPMAARPILMPPPGMTPMEWKACVAFGDKLEFNVTHPGLFDRSTDGLFNPELPRGNLPVGIIGPFSPVVKSGEVVVGYVDDTTKKLFLVTLIIQPTCP